MSPTPANANPTTTHDATLTGSGASAQGSNSKALGACSVEANHNTGMQFISTYYAASDKKLSPEEIKQQVVKYLDWLRDHTNSIVLRDIKNAKPPKPLPLEAVYVPLRAKAVLDGQEKYRGHGEFAKHAAGDTDIDLSQVLGLGKQLAVIGGPGSGKTTVLQHIAWALATSLKTNQAEPARSRLGLSVEPSALPLPIFVPLASFARHRRNPAYTAAHQITLTHFISHHLIAEQASDNLPDDFFVQLLKEGRNVLLLLDGLDEVANADERAEVREEVENLVCGRPELRVVVTCRTIAYRDGRTALPNFREITVQALDHAQHITPMVEQAYACIYHDDAARRKERTKNLLNGILQLEQERREREGNHAEALVTSPLMVRLLLIVHHSNHVLPNERAELFEQATNALLQGNYGRDEKNKTELKTGWEQYFKMAQHLAFRMHQQGKEQGREIEEWSLEAVLREEPNFAAHIDEFLVYTRQRGGLLEERDNAYRFIHHAFQEFLTAHYLHPVIRAKSLAETIAFLTEKLDDPWWREPILLLLGFRPKQSDSLARQLISALAQAGTTANARFAAAELAGTATLEWRESGEALRAECARRIVELLQDADALQKSQAVVRARAGDVLSQLGDPRFDPQRLYLPNDELLGFEFIPEDPQFRIGTRKADKQKARANDNEISDDITPAPACYLARYPVTVAQFRVFVEATKFPLGDQDALRDPDNHPVSFVSWHEARAYYDWLNDRLLNEPALQTSPVAQWLRQGWRIGLPSELEWEHAVRGGKRDLVYPWGDQPDPNRANYDDTGIANTSSVGCFPPNDYGLYDMSGNVWEWTRSHFKDYPYKAEDVREDLNAGDDVRRVVRGGSRGLRVELARCADRNWDHPVDRDYDIGFRVVLCFSPVNSGL